MASRIGIVGDVNSGKSWSRRYIKNGEEVFIIHPSQKRNYLTKSNGDPIQPFIYRPKGTAPKNWEDVYRFPLFEGRVAAPEHVLATLSHIFFQKVKNDPANAEAFKANLTPNNLVGNSHLITGDIMSAKIWLQFISDWMPWIKVIIVSDFIHFINKEVAKSSFIERKAGGEAYQRFWELSADLLNAFILSVDNLRSDLIVVMEFHTEWDKERMRYELFIPAGNMLKEKFKPESYFDVLLFCDVQRTVDAGGNEMNKYRFVTKSNTLYPQARSSDLFGEDTRYVDNNLELVLSAFRKNIFNEQYQYDEPTKPEPAQPAATETTPPANVGSTAENASVGTAASESTVAPDDM